MLGIGFFTLLIGAMSLAEANEPKASLIIISIGLAFCGIGTLTEKWRAHVEAEKNRKRNYYRKHPVNDASYPSFL